MSATLGQLVTDVRSHLDEASSRFWTDVELRRWCNEALRDVARRAETLQRTSTVTAVANTQQYTLATDILRVYRVEYLPTGSGQVYPLEYRDFNSMDSVWWSSQTQTKGIPFWYTLWGFTPALKMIVYPTPSTGGTFNVFNYQLPADLATDGSADSTVVDLPNGWQDLIALYCEYVSLRKDADSRWQEAKGIYEERLGSMIDVTRRWTDQSDSIQIGSGGFLPFWLYGGD